MCDCNKTTNISMGCCQPVLGPIEAYYTKFTIDRKLEEITSAITSGVTEEQLNEAIASAKTEIEGEMPSLSGYATEQWVEDKHYITGVDLSDYATTEQMNNAITAATDGLATEEYVNAQISSQTSDFVTGVELSSYTYDKVTIDEKIAGGGIFDPTQYFNTAQTINLVESAVKRVEGEIPTVPTDISAFNNDAGYITGVDLSNYATTGDVTNVSTALIEHSSDATIHVTPEQVSNWSSKANVWCGSEADWSQISGGTLDSNTIYLVY